MTLLFSDLREVPLHTVGIFVAQKGVQNKLVLRQELVWIFIALATFLLSGKQLDIKQGNCIIKQEVVKSPEFFPSRGPFLL